MNYRDVFRISAHEREFDDPRAGPIDIHTMPDLLETYRHIQGISPEGLPEEFSSRNPSSRPANQPIET